MEKEFKKAMIVQLVDLGYGKIKNRKIKLDIEKIKDKIKELDSIELDKDVYTAAVDKNCVLFVVIAFIIHEDVNEFIDIINNEDKVKTPEGLELYVFLSLFYDIDALECYGEYYKLKFFEDIDSLIKRYEQIKLTYIN